MFGVLTARYLMAFAYYEWTADIVRDVIYQSGFSIRPSVCPSVCLSQLHCMFAVQRAGSPCLAETARDFTINDADNDSV